MTTEERLEKLEAELATAKRNNRRLMAGVGLVLGVFILFVAVRAITGVAYSQAGGDVEKVIRANKFEVVDNQGRTRAIFTEVTSGAGLAIFDEKGKTQILLSMDKETGPALILHDETSDFSATLSVKKVGPALSLNDERGNIRAGLVVMEEGPSLSLYDKKGASRARFGVSQTGTPDGKSITYPESSLHLFGPDSKVIWSAP